MTAMTFSDPRLAKLNGFHVELNAEKERADIVLDRPPLNVIEMPQRDQLRMVFEAGWCSRLSMKMTACA